MIKLDLSKAVNESAIEKLGEQVEKLATKMENLETLGFEWLGWKDLPNQINPAEIKKIKDTVKRLEKESVDTLVVIGIGGSFAGAKAGIDMVKGEYPNSKGMEVVYIGNSISSTNLAQKLVYLQDKNFAINVISKSGTTTEPAIAFRLVKKLLEDKVGYNNASKFIVATTSAKHGALIKMSQQKEYETFIIPENIGGRFSVLTPVGLFPMACAGLDIDKMLSGAKKATDKYSKTSLMQNDAYKYAVARTILGTKFPAEMMVQYEPQMAAFNEWWKQLAGESEGKNQKGLLPTSAIFSTDLHSLGQFIQDGSKVLFETVVLVENPNVDVEMIGDESNLDNLNYLEDVTINHINSVAAQATIDAHVKVGKVPNIIITIEKMDETNFGELVIFFERAVAMTAYLLGVNPFNQPGVEVYKQNMFKLLGKPE